MLKFSSLTAQIMLVTLVAVSGASAQSNAGILEQRLKSELNTTVQEVREAQTPSEKREILGRFIDKVERGSAKIQKLPFLTQENRAALSLLQEKFGEYAAELHGVPGPESSQPGVTNGELDAFASYVQQDLEQANGIYLSTGAIIIVLLILLIIT